MKRRPATPPNAFDMTLVIESVDAVVWTHWIGDHGEVERLMDQVNRHVRMMKLKFKAVQGKS